MNENMTETEKGMNERKYKRLNETMNEMTTQINKLNE
jgi:hypothetical protein